MELFEHQKTGIEFLKKTKKCILADEMGLGKTRQAIVAAGNDAKIIVVCPASLKINWRREIWSVYPSADIAILQTDCDESKHWDRIPEWTIVNYDILEKKIDVIEWLIEGGAKTLILDEAHYIKGKSIRATVIIGGKVKKKSSGEQVMFEGIAPKMERIYCLTGTPLMNRPIELYNLLKAVGHDLGRSRSFYAKRYCGAYLKTIIRRAPLPAIRYMDESGATNIPELRKYMEGVMLRRRKKEVLNLPEKIVSIMECELSHEWKKTYDSAWDDYLHFLAENPDENRDMEGILMARHLVEVQKLKQVCSRSKIARMVGDIRNEVEQGQKVIVFSQYTQTIKELKEQLDEKQAGSDPIFSVTLTGADDMHERQKAVDSFQNDEMTKVFIANIKAGGVGLTLTEASIVMFADMEWSPEIHAQAEDRAHRIGQEGTVNVYYYIATDTIEEDIVQILNEKKDVMNQLLEGKTVKRKAETMQQAFLNMIAKKTKG